MFRNLQPSKLKHGLNPYEDGFIPTKYLGNLHAKFSFSALKNAKKTCTRRKEIQSNKLRQFVHDNLEKYIYLKDKLEEFLIGDREGRNIFNDNAVAGLEQSFDNLQSYCKNLFSPMIKTQQMGEEIRSMVNIVDKLKFLFIIPSDIKQNRERVSTFDRKNCFSFNRKNIRKLSSTTKKQSILSREIPLLRF